MNSLQNWINANELTINFNPNKSCYNVFKPKNKNLPSGYDRGIQIGENILTYKESIKYLGIILDDKMTWKAHIAEFLKQSFDNIMIYILRLGSN